MRRMTARRNGPCANAHLSGCAGVRAGDTIVWERGQGAWHAGCGPTGVDPAGDREYMQGMHEARESREIRQMFGEGAAIEYERRMDELAGDY
jgi:hypothetical protein